MEGTVGPLLFPTDCRFISKDAYQDLSYISVFNSHSQRRGPSDCDFGTSACDTECFCV